MNFDEIKCNIFEIRSDFQFNETALEIFQFQYSHNSVYRQYVDLNHYDTGKISHFSEIPFIPIEFFKHFEIICSGFKPEVVFRSSGTTGSETSRHYVSDLRLYEESFLRGFKLFYGSPDQYTILAVLPSYLERNDSSLIYMVDKLIQMSGNSESGFFLEDYHEIGKRICSSSAKKVLLLGVTFALIDLAEKSELDLNNGIVMETGGMKGRRREIVRDELHHLLCSGFKTDVIHSEYGMTELLSQAYSKGNGIFKTPPWMKILIRDVNDPMTLLGEGATGGINVIDLANLYSCSFIAAQDLGKTYHDGSFEVLGRFDSSDIRGCNLMV